MAKATFTILAALSLAATSLMAQSRLGITVNIPFTFVAGAKAYPAGVYNVQAGPVEGVVSISGADSEANQFMLAKPLVSTQTTDLMALQFNRYGDRYFLSQVWTGGGLGRELRKSRAEREQIAASGKHTATVSLTATR
jgi:hypothetical protein